MSQLLFSTRAYAPLAEALAREDGFELGVIERKDFPDAEHYRRVASDPAGRHVVLVGGTVTDADTLELFDLATTLVMLGAQSLTLIVPYFGYSTMERAVRPGEVVGAKTRARLLSAVPRASIGDRIFLLDLHSEGIPYYFEGSLRPVHLYGKELVKAAALELAGEAPFVLACTDAGRAKWVESLANDLGVAAAFVFKRRLSGSETQVTAVSAQVDGQHVIIYDDMIRTGGSLVQAARAYREAGASRVSAVATHGVLPGDSLSRIRSAGVIDRIVVTDSHPHAGAQACDFLRVKSIAPMLVAHLRNPT